MQIELSQDEMETLQQALESWERDASMGALMGSLVGAMLTRPGEDRDKERIRNEEMMRKAEEEGKRRKLKSLMLRAKLAQAVTHLLTTPT